MSPSIGDRNSFEETFERMSTPVSAYAEYHGLPVATICTPPPVEDILVFRTDACALKYKAYADLIETTYNLALCDNPYDNLIANYMYEHVVLLIINFCLVHGYLPTIFSVECELDDHVVSISVDTTVYVRDNAICVGSESGDKVYTLTTHTTYQSGWVVEDCVDFKVYSKSSKKPKSDDAVKAPKKPYKKSVDKARNTKSKCIHDLVCDLIDTPTVPQSGILSSLQFATSMQLPAVLSDVERLVQKGDAVLDDLGPSIKSVTDSFTGSADKLDGLVDVLTKLVSQVSTGVPESTEGLMKDLNSGVSSVMDSLLNTLTKYGKKLIVFVCCVLLVYGYFSNSVLTVKGAAAVLMFCGVVEGVTVVVKMLESYDKTEPQAIDIDMIPLLSKLIVSCFSLFDVFRSSDHPKMVKSFCGHLSRFSSTATSLQSVFELVVTLINTGLDKFVPGYSAHKFFTTSEPKVRDLLTEITSLVQQCESNPGSATPETYQLCAELFARTCGLIEKFKGPNDSHMRELLKYALTRLDRLRGRIASIANAGDNVRAEPTSFLFRGGPGIGKSLFIQWLYTRILNETLTSEELELFRSNSSHFVYNRASELKYWDGYRSTARIILFDDFMQSIDSDPDNEVMNMIRVVNSFPYALHMADLESKGTKFMRAKFVLSTTNLKEFRPTTILDAKALDRRFDLDLVMRPKKDFCVDPYADDMTAKLDLDKVAALSGGPFHPEVYEFVSKTGRIYTAEQLVQYAIESDRRKTKFYEDFLTQLNSIEPQSGWNETNLNCHFPTPEDGVNRHRREFRMHLLISTYMIHTRYWVIPTPEYVLDLWVKNFNRLHPPTHADNAVTAEDVLMMPDDKFAMWMEWSNHNYFEDPDFPSFNLIDKLSVVISRYAAATSISRFLGDADKIQNMIFWASQYFLYAGTLWVCLRVLETIGQWLFNLLWPNVSESQGGFTKYSDHQTRTGVRKGQVKPDVDPYYGNHVGAVPQGGNLDDVISSIWRNNVFEVTVSGGSGKLGYATFIHENIVMMPYHFYRIIHHKLVVERGVEPASIVYTFTGFNTKKESFNITFEELIAGGMPHKLNSERDIFLFRLPKRILFKSSLVPKFVQAESGVFDGKDTFDSVLVTQNWNNDTIESKYRNVLSYFIAEKQSDVAIGSYVVKTNRAIRYTADTRNGDCGALLFTADGSIVGMHILGNVTQNWGFVTGIDFDEINDYLSKFSVVQPQCGFKPTKSPAKQFNSAYEVPGNLTPNVSGRSSIIRTPMNGVTFQCHTLPARLTPFVNPEGEVIDPYKLSISKYGANDAIIDTGHIDRVVLSYRNFMMRKLDRKFARVLTFEEAIIGKPSECLAPIARNTSPGWPFVLSSKLPGKTEWFGSGETYDLDTPKARELRVRVDEIIAKAKEGTRSLHVFNDFLKDERLPAEKVLNGKARLISASPLDLIVVYHMYFGTFVQAMHKAKIVCGSGLGINPYGDDWDSLVMELLSNASDSDDYAIGAGDYSGFDASEKPEIHQRLLSVINDFYQDDNDGIREILWAELYNSIHIRGNLIYQWNASLPSGHPMTTVVNNMYNNVIMRACWADVYDRSEWAYAEFDSCVKLVTFGDDNIFSVSHPHRSSYNEFTISEAMSKYGMKYTNELKADRNDEFYVSGLRRISDVTFLKRGFKFHPDINKWCAPLDIGTIQDMVQWTKRGSHQTENVLMTCQTAILETSLHGRHVFDDIGRRIMDALRKFYSKGGVLPIKYVEYETCRHKCIGLDFF